ncbi:MAG TPA: phospholipase D-like domain-containing protein [Thermoanaerobaculia bacterium]|nr:phospholipase D-like domain-containing protein [Thermoanaerobaculia bacterium]
MRFLKSLMIAMVFASSAFAASPGDVVINEIAWMGTTGSTSNEWIELYNTTGSSISFTSWTLKAADNTPSVTLSGSIGAYGYYLLERTDDNTIPGITADKIYTGAMTDTGEQLVLRDASNNVIDTANQNGSWFTGTTTGRATMARSEPGLSGTTSGSWHTSTASYGSGLGLGTPKAANVLGGTSDDWYALYFTDHLNTVMPDYGPKTIATALIDAIDNSTTSIDFSVYGFNGCEEIIDALDAAQTRGVTVRGVVDSYASGFYPYRATQTVIDRIGTVIADADDRIMHNKFFVIDGRYVWTGSTNISRPEIEAEYYSDVAILIDDTNLAGVYTDEFEEMYGGDFHDEKTDNTTHVLPTLADGTVIESYFAPTDDAQTHAIVRAINQAQTKINMRTFFLTSQTIVDALEDAKDRGVTIRIILDAASAHNEYSLHEALRTYGVSVKVENWGGTEHIKAFSVDSWIVVLGSQNFTASGNTSSDENTLYIQNRPLAASFDSAFDTAWNSISGTWATADPDPESSDSPGSLSDLIDNDHDDLTDEGAAESINTTSTADGAINVYFNRQAVPAGASSGSNIANYNVNLEDRLTARIATATSTIDLATYELELPDVVDELIDRADNGVQVRIVADAKDPLNEDLSEDASYKRARVFYEKILRGADNTLGTSDDGHVFADSAIFAVTDSTFRTSYGLPSSPSDLPSVTVKIGTTTVSGYLLADGELKNTSGGLNNYYSYGDQMHNKFVIIDGTWVWTGSWNFTVNDTFGSEANRTANIRSGHTNHGVEIRSADLAAAYTAEFEEMWGSSTATPNINDSDFHSRKADNGTHSVYVGGKLVEVYFSPSEGALARVDQIVASDADESARFCIYAFSDQTLTDTLKNLYEGSTTELTGTLTGFKIQGVFESGYWSQYWSSNLDMTSVESSPDASYSNRWNNPAPVGFDGEDKLLHHKYMIVDEGTASDPFVITGSMNWSENGENTNDENTLIIHDAAIANQFYQEFAARYYMAYGIVDFLK